MQDKNFIIKHRGLSFYFLILVSTVMFLLSIGTILIFFNTNQPFFILGAVFFIYITYIPLRYALIPKIELSKEYLEMRYFKQKTEMAIYPKINKVTIKIKDINKIILATGRRLYKSTKFKTNKFIKEEISKMKKEISKTKSLKFRPITRHMLWVASQLQPHMYIITKTKKKYLVNLDIFTKRDILKLLKELENLGITIENTV